MSFAAESRRMERGGLRHSLPPQDNMERTGNGKSSSNRKALTLMNRHFSSLQSESSADRVSTAGEDTLSRSTGGQSLKIMKSSASMGEFETREIPKFVATPTRQEAFDLHEVSERSSVSSSTRLRSSATETSINQPQPQQQQLKQEQSLSVDVNGHTAIKTPDNKSPKGVDKDANAAARHRRERFFKNFPDIAVQDDLLEYYYCAYSRDILFPGFMYVTNGWICFHSKFLPKKNIRIPVHSIIEITKARTAKLIPNAICIVTHQERHFFASLVSRDRTFGLFMKIWKPKPKPEDDESLNGSSQNGDRNYVNDDISASSDDNSPSASEDSALYEGQAASGSRNDLMSGGGGGGAGGEGQAESPEVAVRRRVTSNSCEALSSHDVTGNGGKTSEHSGNSNSREPRNGIWRSGFQLPKISSTTIILSLTTVLIVFLILSACMLALRLVQLQAQMEATFLPINAEPHFRESEFQDQLSEDIYHLKHEKHLSSMQRLHSLLEVHLKLLDKVNQSLKSLTKSSLKDCSGLSADEYTSDSNS